MEIVNRFLGYTKFVTTSDDNNNSCPSTENQRPFAEALVKELKEIGMQEVTIDDNCYVMATLPATQEGLPTIGFIAHLDTAPDFNAEGCNPRIVENYNGNDITLSADGKIILSPSEFPELKQYVGQDIIVTDGTTLLGADDKAGIAAIMTAMQYLIDKGDEIKHGKVRVAFTPDEEIGRGAAKFNVEQFGAEWAYTIDGGEIGELEYENFNAAGANITINGLNVHPGQAKGKMINALLVANDIISMFPNNETPATTEGYEGFFHLIKANGSVDSATISYIIRDHDITKFEERKKLTVEIIQKVNKQYGREVAILELKDQYFNMKEKIEPVIHIIERAKKAMIEAGITPNIKPIRGGTDGCQLSFKGLPCPNIFAGGHNFHGRYEYLPISSLKKACETIINIIKE